MASIQKIPNSRNWIAFYRTPDGKQKAKSTGFAAIYDNRVKAMRVAETLEKATRDVNMIARLRKLVAEFAEEAGEEARKPSTVREFCNAWVDGKQRSVAASTHAFYKIAVARFLKWLGADAARDMMGMARRRLEQYRDWMATTLTPQTANHNLKVLRMIFRRARIDNITFTDPAEGVDLVRQPKLVRRRPFTLEELRAVLAVAEGEWRGIILFGLYTGQRLGDIAQLTWENIDLTADGGRGQLTLITSKTGRSQFIPLHAVLRDYLVGLNAGDDPQAPLFPNAEAAVMAAGGQAGTLSNRFANILAAAGLREKISHTARRDGRDQVLARVYAVAVLTLQRWIAAGEAAKDPCPITRPSEMPAWWSRVMKRHPSRGILNAAARYRNEIANLPQEVFGRGGAGTKKLTSRVSFHSLRHTATSLLKSAGVSVSVVMDLIGHDDVTMSQHYTHTGDSERRQAIDSLPAL